MAFLVPDLLDTNIFVHLVRDDAIGQRLKRERQLLLTNIVPAYCVVTEGEIRSLALQFNWGEDKVDQMEYLLDYFSSISIETREIMRAYAVIDARSKITGITMGKNDAWIAAAAHDFGFELLTTDHDFDHLQGIFLSRTRIHIEREDVEA